VSAQHLRPLFAFVVVAIVGGLVFANALRAQDVVDAIRAGSANVLAGTPLMHDPLYVVEEGMRLDAAESPEPEVDPSAEAADSAPVGTVEGAAPSTDVAPTDDKTAPDGDRGQAPGQAAGDPPGAPKAGASNEGHGPDSDPGRPEASGPGGGHDGPKGDDKGHDEGKDDDRTGHDEPKGHANADDKSGDGKAKGHGQSDHGEAKGHDKKDHGEAKGHGQSDHGEAKGHGKKDHGGKDRGRP
jgi:hypothetical protein